MNTSKKNEHEVEKIEISGMTSPEMSEEEGLRVSGPSKVEGGQSSLTDQVTDAPQSHQKQVTQNQQHEPKPNA